MTVSDTPQRSVPRSGGIQLAARGTGAWLLSLRERQIWAAGTVQQLEVEILFPVAQSGVVVASENFGPPSGAAAAALRRRRGRVRRAELCIDQASLNRALALPLIRPPTRLPPFERLHACIEASDYPSLLLVFRLPLDGSASDAGAPYPATPDDQAARPGATERESVTGCARIAIRRAPTGYHDAVFGVSELLLFAPCPYPAPLVAHALLQRLAAALLAYRPPDWPPVQLPTGPSSLGLHLWLTPGLSELRLELLHDALLDTLPRHGYRAADPTTAPLSELSCEPGRLLLRYAGEGGRGLSYADLDERPRSNPVIDGSAAQLGAPLPEVIRIADHLAYGGDIVAALAAYRMAAAIPALASLARTRRLQFLASAPPCHDEAQSLAAELHKESPAAAAPLLVLAAIAAERGLDEAAADAYRSLAMVREQHPIVRALSFYAAARQLGASKPQAAVSLAVEAEGILTPLDLDDELRVFLRGLAVDARGRLRPPAGQSGTTFAPVPATSSSQDGPPSASSSVSTTQRRELLPARLLQALQHDEPAAALRQVEAALANSAPGMVQTDPGWLPLLLASAQLCIGQGEIERARAFLTQAGPHTESLRMRVRLDWPELLAAEPGSAADLLPVLRALQLQKSATPDELRGLARLLTLRGEHAEAITAQRQAGGDPDELLAVLEAAGRFSDLLRALRIHAELRPADASLLYQQAGNVAEQQLDDRAQAAALWQRAAEIATSAGHDASTDVAESTAILWFHAGRLWRECGELDRAYAALGQAVARGGRDLPRAQLMLADLAYALRDPEAAMFYYRQALHAGQVPVTMRATVYLRLAELSRQREDGHGEEQSLASAVEAGGGADAWPRLAELFARRGDLQRRSMALVAWADHLPEKDRPALLFDAAASAPDLVLSRIDEELVRLRADDEAVRDRALARLAAQNDVTARLQLLRYDVGRSQSSRKRRHARELVELSLQVSDYDAAVYGWLAILDAIEADAAAAGAMAQAGQVASSDDAITVPRALLPENGVQAFLGFWRTLQRAGHRLNVTAGDLAELRERMVRLGSLPELLERSDRMLSLMGTEPSGEAQVRALRWQVATLAELVGEPLLAAQRYLQLCSGPTSDRKALTAFRTLCRALVKSGQASTLLALIEGEGHKPGIAPAGQALLRVAQAEVQLFLGRAAEAEGLLASALQALPTCGPAHAMLGMLLSTASEVEISQRGLQHLLYAAYAPDVAAPEAGECALLAADLLAAAGITEPIELSLLQGEEFVEKSFSDRASAGTFVAIPADFLSTPSMDEAVPVNIIDPVSDPLRARATAVPEGQGAVVPLLLGPEELLLHAGALLPGDPRPIEGLLGLSWTRGQDSVALECCERLLALPSISADPAERARLHLEKSHVHLRLGQPAAAEAALRQALLDAPNSLAAVRGLRQLLLAPRSAPDGEVRPLAGTHKRLLEAQDLLQRELLLSSPTLPGASPAADSANRLAPAELYFELGEVAAKLGEEDAAREWFRRAGLQGLARGFVRLSELLAQAEDWLAAADVAGRAALLSSGSSDVAGRGQLLLIAAEYALRADDELRAREHLSQALSLGGEEAGEAEARLLSLDGGHDPERRRRSLERRLQQAGPGVERIELQHRLLLLCCEQFDRDAMVSHAVALLRDAPGDAIALCALAEDAIERGQMDAAAERLALLDVLPIGYPRVSRLLAWLADQHERRGAHEKAATAYEQLLALGERSDDITAIEDALEGLARLAEERGDLAAALRLLRRRLPYLPPDALTARSTLRLRLCDLALALGDVPEARSQLLAILSEQPQQRSALVKLLDVYRRGELRPPEIQESLSIIDKLLDLAMTPGERAEWLFARGELYERSLHDLVRARADYERAIGQWPGHARALRRLLYLAARRADGEDIVRHLGGLQRANAFLGEVQHVTALALTLPTESADAETLLARRKQALTLLENVEIEDMAEALSLLGADALRQPKVAQRLRDLRSLDAPVAVALQALGGDASALAQALLLRLRREDGSLRLSVLSALALLSERLGMGAQMLYLSTQAFVTGLGHTSSGDEAGSAWAGGAQRMFFAPQSLDDLGALPVPEAVLEAALARLRPLPTELVPWQIALSLLGRYLLGLQGAPLRLSHEWSELLLELSRSLGLGAVEVALLDDEELPQSEQPAACDPSRPVRLRLLRRLTQPGSEGLARFAALRALLLLRSGVALVHNPAVGPERVGGLLRAAIALWLSGGGEGPSLDDLRPSESEWLSPLRASALHPDHGSGVIYEARGESEVLRYCFSRLAEDANYLHSIWPTLRERLLLEANARALGQLGDLRAALSVLTPPNADTSARLLALMQGPVADLFAIANAIYLQL
ncbi:MAG TPA: hypothetical protein PKI03_02715 [Pseudomonadota bacterium]|nr:hypothetical protein [Pseudomonadota bacterium]